jgi:hypothetical protein
MANLVAAGTWVEISAIVLEPNRRASHIPDDTQRLPLEMRVKGFLVAPAALGDEAEIVTSAGRKLGGILTAVNPPYSHGFGAPIPELSEIGGSVRALLRARGQTP